MHLESLPTHYCMPPIYECVHIAGLLLASGDAQASRLIPTSQMTSFAAYDYDVPLRVVSLAGSVPAEWVADFKQALQVGCTIPFVVTLPILFRISISVLGIFFTAWRLGMATRQQIQAL